MATSKPIPPKLHKYQSLDCDSHTLENLSKCQLWSSTPDKLNDPFDCSIPYRLLEISDEQWLDGWRQLKGRLEKDKGARGVSRAEERYLTHEVPNQLFRDEIVNVNNANFRKVLQNNKGYGVACFSESFQNILMWSHYADAHKGICLEFDTTYPPFDDTRKFHWIRYCDTYPVLSPVEFFSMPALLGITPLITKAKSWEYEQEWRCIKEAGNTAIPYDPKALCAIYFGSLMPDYQKAIIAAITATSGTRLFAMRLSETEFKLEYEPYHP